MTTKQDRMRAREQVHEQVVDLLTQIKNLLTPVPTVTTAPPRPGRVGVPLPSPSMADLQAALQTVFDSYGILKRANDWYVYFLDLSTPTQGTGPYEVASLENALALTIFTCTGTFVLYLNKASDDHKITINALTYPQTLVIDWMDIKKVYILNSTAQTGLNATILAFFRR